MTSESSHYADRTYRSGSALAGGVLLLALIGWLGGDALVRGDGRTRALACAALLLIIPLVIAFTLRPAVYAGDDRLRVRNPFRTITLPWATVDDVRARLSSEVLSGGKRYQIWAIPVSLRQRKRAARLANHATAASAAGGVKGRSRLTAGLRAAAGPAGASRAAGDQAIDELSELAKRNASRESARGEREIRWAYEIIGPAVVGAIALAVLIAVG